MSYTIKHTAEAIDGKLKLINENKNLLPYPYDRATPFPPSLEDVGDGSFLTTGETTTEPEIFLNDCSLAGGTYVSSLTVTNIVDSSEDIENPGFSLKIVIDGVNQESSFTIDKDTNKAAAIYLVVPANCSTKNLLIKPMIEKGTESTTWVPYMGNIGTYVDERFNSTNVKIAKVAEDVNNKISKTGGTFTLGEYGGTLKIDADQTGIPTLQVNSDVPYLKIATSVLALTSTGQSNGSMTVLQTSEDELSVRNYETNLKPVLLGNPNSDYHAATKAYVDDAVNDKISKTGGTFTLGSAGATLDIGDSCGVATLGVNSSSPNLCVNTNSLLITPIGYGASDSKTIALAPNPEGLPNGLAVVSGSSQTLTNLVVADPTDDEHAATKGYVDDLIDGLIPSGVIPSGSGEVEGFASASDTQIPTVCKWYKIGNTCHVKIIGGLTDVEEKIITLPTTAPKPSVGGSCMSATIHVLTNVDASGGTYAGTFNFASLHGNTITFTPTNTDIGGSGGGSLGIAIIDATYLCD